MYDHRALDAGAATPTALSDDLVVGLASALEHAARAYAAAVDRTDRANGGDPWGEEARARARSLLSECRAMADRLIDARAETRAASAAKRRALVRYWEVDVDCDPRAFRLLISVCADFERLDAESGAVPSRSESRRLSQQVKRHNGRGR